MTTTKATKKPTKQPTNLTRVRRQWQEQQRWELFAAAALTNVSLYDNASSNAVDVAKQADAMVEEWRKRWGRK